MRLFLPFQVHSLNVIYVLNGYVGSNSDRVHAVENIKDVCRKNNSEFLLWTATDVLMSQKIW